MRLHTLRLKDYRNYQSVTCGFPPGLTMISGANAQGKTNLVESIYYLSIGKAYRQAKDEQLIRWGANGFTISAGVESRKGSVEMEVCYHREAKPAKTLTADGLRCNRWEEMNGILTSVLFSPESMAIVKGAPQERRSFLDYDIMQISQTYGMDMYRYKRILAQRNALLKKLGFLSVPLAQKKDQLSPWDQQLITYGSRIIEKRLAFLEKMAPMARLTQRKLTEGKENIELRYIHSGKRFVFPTADVKRTDEGGSLKADSKAFLTDVCQGALHEDLRFGITQWGPHRDDIRILLDGVDLRQFGSKGQQRTGVLALKLAELEVFRGESGEYPILLLDDVFSELDEYRQKQLLSIVNEKSIQCIITSAEGKYSEYLEKKQSKHYLVRQGEIRELSPLP